MPSARYTRMGYPLPSPSLHLRYLFRWLAAYEFPIWLAVDCMAFLVGRTLEKVRYYKVHDLVACIMEDDGLQLLLSSYEVKPFTEDEANLLFLPLRKSPSDAVTIERGASEIKMRWREQSRWECYGVGHDVYLICQDIFLSKGASFVHGCAIEWKGRGMLFWGRGGVGKTAIALLALKEPGVRILADDVAIIRADGRILSFHKPLALYPYHLPVLSERGKKWGKYLRLATMTASVRPLWWLGRKVKRWVISKRGAVKSWAGRMNPGWISVFPEELFSRKQLAEQSQGAVAIMLTRGRERWHTREMLSDEAVRLLLPVTYKELGITDSIFDYAAAGAIALPKHIKAVDEVMVSFAQKIQHLHINVPRECSIKEVQDRIREFLQTFK